MMAGECMTAELAQKQRDRVRDYLREHPEGLTVLEAWEQLGIISLSSRIAELREEATILKVREHVLNRFGERTNIVRYKMAVRF